MRPHFGAYYYKAIDQLPSDSCLLSLPLPLFLCHSLTLLCLVSFSPFLESNRRGANWIEACQCAQRAPTTDKTNLGLLVAIRGLRRGRQTPIESSHKAIQLATAVANAAYSHTIIAVVAQKTFQWVSCLPRTRIQVNSSLELARTWELQLSLRQVLDGPGGITMGHRIESGQTKQHLQQFNCLPSNESNLYRALYRFIPVPSVIKVCTVGGDR